MASEQLRLVDGTIVRKCPTIKPLYCSRAGKFYSLHNAILTDDGWVLREIKPNVNQTRLRTWVSSQGITGSQYPTIRQSHGQPCHKLVALAWLGPRPEGTEIDHLNGNKLDWSVDNLEYVTPAENRKRARLLRVLRSIGRDPRKMSREELLGIFRKYEFVDGSKQMEYEMTHHMEV